MPSANKTPNYNLTQYSNNGSDKISALKDYNEDMSKIDIALNDNANNIINKADKSTTYSKLDVDEKLNTKADKSTTYTKTEVDEKTNAKADATDINLINLTNFSTRNVAYMGVIANGTADVGPRVNELLSSDINGLYFPDGNYLVRTPIVVPPFKKITLSGGARLFADSAIDSIVEIFSGSTETNNAGICGGGVVDGGNFTKSVIAGHGTIVEINGITVKGVSGIGIDLSDAHASIVRNITILSTPDGTLTGIKTNYDSQFSDIRMWMTHTMFETQGMNMFSNIYGWNANTTSQYSCGFKNYDNHEFDVRGVNIYIDCYATSFYTNTPSNISIKNFIPMFNSNSNDGLSNYIFDIPQNSSIDIDENLDNYSGHKVSVFKNTPPMQYRIGWFTGAYSLMSNILDINNVFSVQNRSIFNKSVTIQNAPIVLKTDEAVQIFKMEYGSIRIEISNYYGEIVFQTKLDNYGNYKVFSNEKGDYTFFTDNTGGLYIGNTQAKDLTVDNTVIKIYSAGRGVSGHATFITGQSQVVPTTGLTTIVAA